MTTGKSGGAPEARAGVLSDKVCVVSGVGPGLGRQAAKALASHAAALVLGARGQPPLDKVLVGDSWGPFRGCGGRHGDAAAPAGPGGLRHLQGGVVDRDEGARLRTGPVE